MHRSLAVSGEQCTPILGDRPWRTALDAKSEASELQNACSALHIWYLS